MFEGWAAFPSPPSWARGAGARKNLSLRRRSGPRAIFNEGVTTRPPAAKKRAVITIIRPLFLRGAFDDHMWMQLDEGRGKGVRKVLEVGGEEPPHPGVAGAGAGPVGAGHPGLGAGGTGSTAVSSLKHRCNLILSAHCPEQEEQRRRRDRAACNREKQAGDGLRPSHSGTSCCA